MSINRRLPRTFPALAAIAFVVCSTAYGLGHWVGAKIERSARASEVPRTIAITHRPAHPARAQRHRYAPPRRNPGPLESPG